MPEVLNLADVVRIDPAFSREEQGRARAATARDPRQRIALDATGYGLTQTLAGAPQLVARWKDAETADPYARAVLTAALDEVRRGQREPLSADFLRAAAVDYCTSQQQAEAPDNWFEQALAYATAKLHGDIAALSPAGVGMGKIAGYTVADYLIKHARPQRRYARILVLVDQPQTAGPLVDIGADLAVRQPGSELLLAHLVSPPAEDHLGSVLAWAPSCSR